MLPPPSSANKGIADHAQHRRLHRVATPPKPASLMPTDPLRIIREDAIAIVDE
jgi:hypothetical protein